VKFSQLVTRATGAKATVVRVDRGTIYVSRENTKTDEFTLAARGMRKMTVQPTTHMRLELEGTKTDVAVFSGSVGVEGNGEPVMVGKEADAGQWMSQTPITRVRWRRRWKRVRTTAGTRTFSSITTGMRRELAAGRRVGLA